MLLYYDIINRMQLEGRLTESAVYDRVRLYLAYLDNHRDSHFEGQTSFSVTVKLRAMDFPENIQEVREIYFAFCRS